MLTLSLVLKFHLTCKHNYIYLWKWNCTFLYSLTIFCENINKYKYFQNHCLLCHASAHCKKWLLLCSLFLYSMLTIITIKSKCKLHRFLLTWFLKNKIDTKHYHEVLVICIFTVLLSLIMGGVGKAHCELPRGESHMVGESISDPSFTFRITHMLIVVGQWLKFLGKILSYLLKSLNH